MGVGVTANQFFFLTAKTFDCVNVQVLPTLGVPVNSGGMMPARVHKGAAHPRFLAVVIFPSALDEYFIEPVPKIVTERITPECSVLNGPTLPANSPATIS